MSDATLGSPERPWDTPMNCPSENDYAEMVQGLLSEQKRVALERHVDSCPRCTDLMAELGRMFAPSLTPGALRSRSLPPEAIPHPAEVVLAVSVPKESHRAPTSLPSALIAQRRLATLEVVLAVVHLCWFALSTPLLLRLLSALSRGQTPWNDGSSPTLSSVLIALVLIYVVIWAPLGALWSGIAALGVSRQRPWARTAVAIQAWVSMPSLVLIPLGWLALRELQRASGRPFG